MPPFELESRRQKAIRLRREGFSISQIARFLGLSGAGTVGRWVVGVPPPPWTRRPNAKDEMRSEAIRLRLQGRSYKEIERALGVSRSSLSLWLRDIPLHEEYEQRLRQRRLDAVARRAAAVRAEATARHARIVADAAAEVGELTERELFIAGVVAYWAEGSKHKPWSGRRTLAFTNSDPGMIRLFLAWLRQLGVSWDALTFRVSIHESADVGAALRFWSRVVHVPVSEFRSTSLKRHNPKTPRRNRGSGYVGCLVVRVRRSTDLNSRIAGWCQGIAEACSTAGPGTTDTYGAIRDGLRV